MNYKYPFLDCLDSIQKGQTTLDCMIVVCPIIIKMIYLSCLLFILALISFTLLLITLSALVSNSIHFDLK